ncbi:MAG: formate/nitrite transporter family protein [Clostridiales Family XIII bacterium]|nr:formate/nitrite transporter family protein [Clostridiales Family XIII bacterium]
MSGAKTGNELLEVSIEAAVSKAGASWVRLSVLGILAGAFIAFAAEGSSMAAFNLLADAGTFGLGRALTGAVFAVGLMLVVVAGAELFTGNVLMLGAAFAKRVTWGGLLRSWGIVYAANLAGSLLIVCMMDSSGLWHAGGDLLGAVTIKIAAGKTALGFESAFVLGIMCNWLVCLAVWMAWAAGDVGGKIAAIFFPIWLFVTSGFEHSVANMYYIPAGILAKAVPAYAEKAAEIGVSADALAGLGWQGFFVGNLLPVTLGNIVGGGVFVSLAYLLANRVWTKWTKNI